MKTIMTILKKELARVFKDRKLIIMTFIFPGLMIYAMYSFMGSAISNLVSEDNTVPAIVYTENVPSEFMTLLTAEDSNFLAEYHELESFEVTYQQLEYGNVDFILMFPDTFETDIASDIKPNIEYYYNANEGKSKSAYNTVLSLLVQYEAGLVYDEYGDTDIFLTEEHMIIDEEQAMASAMSMMLPFLIITFLFQGAMTLGPESIAGEKERGTISTLLITPTKRRDLALGKILALSILASLSAASSFVGIIASLPKLMGIEGNTNIYGFKEYVLVLVVLVVAVLVIIGMVSAISALAKNIKEATAYILPVYLLSMVVGISSMFSSTAASEDVLYLIPIYNSVQILTQIFTFQVNSWQFILMVISNVVTAGLFTILLTRMFSSEQVMLSK